MPIQKINRVLYKNLQDPITKIYRKVRCDTSTSGCNDQTVEVYTDSNCCDNNRTKVKYSANTNLSPTYYSSMSEYREARCRTLKQSQYQYRLNEATGEASSYCCSDSSGCNVKIYRPLNTKFATDSAVSAGTRIQRLKYNSLRTSASLSNNSVRYHHSIYKQNPIINKNLNKTTNGCDALNKLRGKSIIHSC